MTKYQLYYEIEKAKYKEDYDKTNVDDKQLTCFDYFKIKFKVIMGKGELNPFLTFLIITLIDSVYNKSGF